MVLSYRQDLIGRCIHDSCCLKHMLPCSNSFPLLRPTITMLCTHCGYWFRNGCATLWRIHQRQRIKSRCVQRSVSLLHKLRSQFKSLCGVSSRVRRSLPTVHAYSNVVDDDLDEWSADQYPTQTLSLSGTAKRYMPKKNRTCRHMIPATNRAIK